MGDLPLHDGLPQDFLARDQNLFRSRFHTTAAVSNRLFSCGEHQRIDAERFESSAPGTEWTSGVH
jgi:hypothetical protein